MKLHHAANRIITLSLLICLLCIAATAGGKSSREKKKPHAVEGIIDLRGWDFRKDGPVHLDGQWEFCRDRLLDPSGFTGRADRKNCGFITVPGLWKHSTVNGECLPGRGKATYRFKILSGPDTGAKTLTVSRVYSAYRLWFNGTLVGEFGKPDGSLKAREDYVFIHNRGVASFALKEGMNELLVHVFNNEYESGGIDRPVKLEDARAAAKRESNRNRTDMIVIGLLLFASIYNILLYHFRKKDASPLYIGLFSLLWAINTYNLQSPILSGVLSRLGNPFLIDYLTIVVEMALCLMFIKSLFPDEFSTFILRLFQVLAVAVMVALLFAGFRVSEKIMNIFFMCCTLILAYNVYVFYNAVSKRREDAVLFFIGFAPLMLGGVNNILYAMWIIDTGNVLHYGVVFFCLMTSMVISRRFARALVRVEELSRDLAEKNLSLRKMDRLKDSFLAGTSHELRTPLHGMIGLSESIIEGAAGSLPAGTVEDLSLIASNGHRLAHMVNDLLDMAKIQQYDLDLNPRPVNLRQVSETVVRLTQPLVGDKPLEIRNNISPDLPPARADEDRIRQVLYNLVGNAVKFTNRGEIELSAKIVGWDGASGDNGAGRMIEISVADTGIGIPDEYKEEIFEAYRQLDDGDTRVYPGTGLGLAITRRIVELHNGTIHVASRDHGGSVFSFTLPLATGQVIETGDEIVIEGGSDPSREDVDLPAGAIPDGTADSVFEHNPVLLVVDDDPVNIRVIRNYFEMKRCVVKAAPDGISALDLIEKDDSIGLVLLDIMMPGMSGYEVCRRIRARRKPEELPVIMLTAKNMMADIDAAFEAGANDFIVKPFRMSELLARVVTMLTQKKIRKSAAGGITIRSRDRVHTLSFEEIVYITSHQKNTVLHTVERDIEAPVLMKEIIDRLPPDIFVRIHKSHVINIRYIRSVSHVLSGRYRVSLRDEDDTVLPVGPAFLESLRKKM